MQTFLPLPSYTGTARVLDTSRLGRQQVEAWQVLQTLRGRLTGFDRHPAVRMWRGHEASLAEYGIVVCSEWVKRGGAPGMLKMFETARLDHAETPIVAPFPSWLGDDRVHSSHRAALLAKAPEIYGPLGWTEKPEVRYYWPL